MKNSVKRIWAFTIYCIILGIACILTGIYVDDSFPTVVGIIVVIIGILNSRRIQ